MFQEPYSAQWIVQMQLVKNSQQNHEKIIKYLILNVLQNNSIKVNISGKTHRLIVLNFWLTNGEDLQMPISNAKYTFTLLLSIEFSYSSQEGLTRALKLNNPLY